MINILIISTCLLLISLSIILLNHLISFLEPFNREKSSPYECGFDPFNSSRLPFSMQFFLISVIFLIFDIEIVIIIPMIPAMSLNTVSWLLISIFFLIILIIGTYVEWLENSIIWIK